MERYRKLILLSIFMIALGVTFSNTLEQGSLGTVLIAVGGLFFIAGMSEKRKMDEQG